MNALPENQTKRFDDAVRGFRQHGPVHVTAGKIHAFLEATSDVDMPPANRLRRLAIEMESLEFELGWNGLRAIYQAAAAADPTDAIVLHLGGFGELLDGRVDDAEAHGSRGHRRRSRASPSRGIGTRAMDSEVAYTLGLLYYNHPARTEDAEGYRSQAIDWFSRAVEWDPGNMIAQLYIAHCFHDRKEWLRAIAEYEKIDLDRLARDWPTWRAVKCREQLAQCYAYAGNREEAVGRFTAFLNDIESWDEKSVEERIVNVDELVAAVTDLLRDPVMLHRTRALVERLGLQKRYHGSELPGYNNALDV